MDAACTIQVSIHVLVNPIVPSTRYVNSWFFVLSLQSDSLVLVHMPLAAQ